MEAAAREAQGGLEWRVTVPEGASVTVEREAAGGAAARAWACLLACVAAAARAWAWLLACVAAAWGRVAGFARKVWRIIGADDSWKAVHGLKVGLSLALVLTFYYTLPLYDGVRGDAKWAMVTVVVVYDDDYTYTVGGSVYKSFSRAVETASASVLALGVHWVADKTGEFETYILTGSIFLLAAVKARIIPTVKARLDYGLTIWILTYGVDDLAALAQRISTVAIGIFMCLAVAVFVCPVWAGQELHLLTTRNMDKLADAQKGCVEDYFAEGPAAQPQARSDGYRCVLNSKAYEDEQANLAWWEPAHGRFGFRHPYGQYGKVGDAMRACAWYMEALSSRASAEARAPEHVKGLLREAGACCARVLREASGSIATMTASSRALGLAVADMNTAVQSLQSMLAETTSLVDDTRPVFTVASLLVELAARVEGVVDAVNDLATLACWC